jgi:membrane-associated phospholipid phosphatase
VKADKHHWYDVVAGAAVGTASGLLITRDRTGRSQTFAWGDGHSGGITYAARF